MPEDEGEFVKLRGGAGDRLQCLLKRVKDALGCVAKRSVNVKDNVLIFYNNDLRSAAMRATFYHHRDMSMAD